MRDPAVWLASRAVSRCVLCEGRARGRPWNLCPGCVAELRRAPRAGSPAPRGVARLCAGFVYEHPMSLLVRRFKYAGDLAAGAGLCDLVGAVAEELGPAGPRPQALLAVPLHAARLRERGFNQSHLLARAVGRGLGVGAAVGMCTRIRDTAPQASLAAAGERRANVHGAFAAAVPPGLAHVALVDDVLTTGATLAAAAAALRAGGCARVDAWVLAVATPGAGPPRLRRRDSTRTARSPR